MDTTNRSSRTIVRALGSAIAVGLIGVGALPAATAEAAGVRSRGPVRSPALVSLPLADPSALPNGAATTVVRYRVVDGRLRLL